LGPLEGGGACTCGVIASIQPHHGPASAAGVVVPAFAAPRVPPCPSSKEAFGAAWAVISEYKGGAGPPMTRA